MEKIENKMEWLRSIRRGETKTGVLDTPKDCTTMSVLIYRWNIEEGPSRGIRITAAYDRPNCQITITGNKVPTLRESFKNKL
jgi:hypothetical protein